MHPRERWVLGADILSCVIFWFAGAGIAYLIEHPHPINLLVFGGGFVFLLYVVWLLMRLEMLEVDPDGVHPYVKLVLMMSAVIYALIVASMLIELSGWEEYLDVDRVTIFTHPWLAPLIILPLLLALAYPSMLGWALMHSRPRAEDDDSWAATRAETLWTLACDLNMMLVFTFVTMRHPTQKVALPALVLLYVFVYGSPRFLMYLFSHSWPRLASAIGTMAWMMWQSVRFA